jgi:exopolysaccharide biosynthesis polyprenyl glycosylphosphotransferase
MTTKAPSPVKREKMAAVADTTMREGATLLARSRRAPEADEYDFVETAGAMALAPEAVPVDELAIARPRTRSSNFTLRLPRLANVANTVSGLLAIVVILWLSDGRSGVWALMLCTVPLVLAISRLVGVGRPSDLWLHRTTVEEVPRLVQESAILTLSLAIINGAVARAPWSVSLALDVWGGSFIALLLGRVLVRGVARRTLRPERCIVIGDFNQAQRVRSRLEAGASRLEIVAALELSVDDIAEMSDTTALDDLVSAYGADRLIIAPSSHDTARDLIRLAKTCNARVSMLPGVLDLAGPEIEVNEINGLRLVGVRRFGMTRASWALKRTFDLTVAATAVVVTSPILIAIAIAIKLDSHGSVLFKQTRVGRDGERFVIFKFRSMVTDAEARKDALRSAKHASEGLFKLHDDPRVTRAGRLLRRSSLDELPQLFNVLRGEMSIVGPRPLVLEEDGSIVGIDRSRLSLPPGITGPWQVLTPRASQAEMVDIDYRYAAHWSLWLDLKIVVATVSHVARRGNL